LKVARIVSRLLVGAVLSVGLVMALGPWLADAFLPVLKWSFIHLDTEDRLVEISINDHGVMSGHERVYRLVIAPERTVFVGDRLVVTDPRGRVKISMVIAYLWQAFVLALPLALAWPALHTREWPVRLTCLALLLSGLTLIDLPLSMWAQVWHIYVDAYAPGTFSPLLMWADFLQSGGRSLLGILAAGLSIFAGRVIFKCDAPPIEDFP
jgi:hypothetical protein